MGDKAQESVSGMEPGLERELVSASEPEWALASELELALGLELEWVWESESVWGPGWATLLVPASA